MDKFKSFLSSMSLQRRDDFARQCGTTYAFLRNVMYGQRIAGEKLCVRIERESGGAVTRQDLRPCDWREIWPELDHSMKAA
jgi:DNA-binding transcriptional regulator YdaS (Cro superfamily)